MNSEKTYKIYLDWNVFNKVEHIKELEQKERQIYRLIETLIKDGDFITPYSNAHINDLLRGYTKNPIYTPGHLKNITELTSNLCLTQYWGEKQTRWHYREPKEYLYSTIEENDETSSSFSSLFQSLNDPISEYAFDLQKRLLALMPVPNKFREICSSHPIFNSIYPRTKVEMNHLALCEDIYAFSFKIKNDFTLYKHFRKFLIECKNKFPQYKNLCNVAQNKIIGNPKYLNWDEMWEEAKPDFKPSSNANYDKIMNLFTTTDLKGYRQDERFANMIDDALHCFYAAHCDVFVTLDGRLYDKAKLVYNKLKIRTVVFKPEEFYVFMNSQ